MNSPVCLLRASQLGDSDGARYTLRRIVLPKIHSHCLQILHGLLSDSYNSPWTRVLHQTRGEWLICHFTHWEDSAPFSPVLHGFCLEGSRLSNRPSGIALGRFCSVFSRSAWILSRRTPSFQSSLWDRCSACLTCMNVIILRRCEAEEGLMEGGSGGKFGKQHFRTAPRSALVLLLPTLPADNLWLSMRLLFAVISSNGQELLRVLTLGTCHLIK
ncbi:uncharacterized protein LOC134366963 isoform X1 [Cynocephalus volans]|uniref:uncharacterized protein LOC134366963 isoform X1 n=1 Tax=Cynocephalus volans TaxID=110931 RepID=UPI002FCC71B3